MATAEVATDETAEETVEEADEGEDEGNMNALDEGQKTGVASQFILESVEGTETFFGFTDKVGVALEGIETHRVVDMGDGDVVGTQLLAKEHILVAVVTETLIERVGQHKFTTDEEVSRVEVLIGVPLALLHCVLVFGGLLVAIAEIMFECFCIATDRDTAVENIGIFQGNVLVDEVWAHHCHVAVDEEQPIILGLLGKQVPDGGTSDILWLNQMPTMFPLFYLTVFCHDAGVRRAVITHEDLVHDAGILSLLAEVTH